MTTLQKILEEYTLAIEHGFKVNSITINPKLDIVIKSEIFSFIPGVKFEIKTTGEIYLWDILVILDENVQEFGLEVQPKNVDV